jgi:hypothetical protein
MNTKTPVLFKSPMTAAQLRRLRLRPVPLHSRSKTAQSFIALSKQFWKRPLSFGLTYCAFCLGLLALTKWITL